MNRNTGIRTPHGKKNITRTNCHETSKKTLFFFSLFLATSEEREKFWGQFFGGEQSHQKNGPKNENAKIGKRYFSPDFLMPPKGRVNKRSGGGGAFFWYSSVEGEVFGPSFFGVRFQRPSERKRYFTTKIGVSALFRVPRSERKSSNFKS